MKIRISFLGLVLLVAGITAVTWWHGQRSSSVNAEELLKIFPERSDDILALTASEMTFLERLGIVPRTRHASLFDGTWFTTSDRDSPLAVVIENSTQSRAQQSGLSEASVVYEALAEGGITRFLAIYPYQSPSKVGPIRSLRPYFLEWAKEHAHSIIHAGGSEEALQNLYFSALVDIDEAETGTLLFRDPNFPRPHNLFADLEKVRANEKPHKNIWFGMPFAFGAPVSASQEATVITIHFSTADYKAVFRYNSEKRSYDRFQNGTAHLDRLTGTQISPSTVIVQFSPASVIDDYGRLEIQTSGSGHALLFLQNTVQNIRWKKENGVTKFITVNEEILSLPPGQIWIAIVDEPSRVSY